MKMNNAHTQKADLGMPAPTQPKEQKTVEIQKYLKLKLEPKRYEHVLSMRDMAVNLAKRYEADLEKVNLAALLHDCAKWMSTSELVEAGANSGVKFDEIERRNPSLLHAIIGVELAIVLFGVNDSEILNAVRTHTTGNSAMTLIDKILYVADFAEPTRTHEGAELVRELAYRDLERAVFEVARYKIDHLLKKGVVIHPNTIGAYNHALWETNDCN